MSVSLTSASNANRVQSAAAVPCPPAVGAAPITVAASSPHAAEPPARSVPRNVYDRSAPRLHRHAEASTCTGCGALFGYRGTEDVSTNGQGCIATSPPTSEGIRTRPAEPVAVHPGLL